MNAISRILGENNENTPSWPKIIEYTEEFRITSLNDAQSKHYVRDTGATGFLATANRHVSRAIGTWLKSIGVPFEYNIDPDA